MTMLPPAAVSLAFADGALEAFVAAGLVIAGIGFAMWLPVAGSKRELRLPQIFMKRRWDLKLCCLSAHECRVPRAEA